MELATLRRRMAGWMAVDDRRPRVARRVAVHCPHTGARVVIDLQLHPTGHPALVLRCSGRPERPPYCDQACRTAAEAVAGPALAQLILPPGRTVPDQID
jgi:hypothetical protein